MLLLVVICKPCIDLKLRVHSVKSQNWNGDSGRTELINRSSKNEQNSPVSPEHHGLSSVCCCCFVGRASPIFLQISPTRCTILLNIFNSLLYMFRASMCPSWGGNYCIYATLVFVTLRQVCWLDSIQPADQTPSIHSDKHQCRTDTVISSWWWAHGCPKHVQKWNKYIKQNCASSWTYLQDSVRYIYKRMHLTQLLYKRRTILKELRSTKMKTYCHLLNFERMKCCWTHNHL